ncbi:MAG TPA: polysaccharide deacetylase family protein [Gemmatimonadaceae bacterium]|nr:polysaccharide deacetylase family protein [Gemmatimonadaceae bacterium]
MSALRSSAVIAATVLLTSCSAAPAASDGAAASSANGTPAAASLTDGLKMDSTVGAVTTPASASMGKVPVLMVHLVTDTDAVYTITRARLRHTLEVLYKHNYRPITVAQLIDKRIDVPAGMRPVVFTFDDASASQFRYVEKDGKLEIDPESAVGIWLAFSQKHPDWKPRATFCLLSGAEAGRSFFGNKNIEGQKTEWRFRKLQFLRDNGFELCNHTLWHANLAKYPDAFVQEQIARGQLAIDSAVPGYKVRTFALPLGVWPKNRALARRGEWKDPKTGVVTKYDYDAILEVAGGPSVSPFDSTFDARRIKRFNLYFDAVDSLIARLERNGNGYVAGGTAPAVAAKQ